MNDNDFISLYLNDLSTLVKSEQTSIEQLVKVGQLIREINETGNKILIFGNGGSAAIASHFSVDLTKNAGIRCMNFNESDLITCFANDYGFDRWVEKAVDFYGDEGDLLIVISSSGNSKNMHNGIKAAKNGNFKNIVTFSGRDSNNPLRKLGDINLWVDSMAYNFVENIHQIWLLALVDLIIGAREYSA